MTDRPQFASSADHYDRYMGRYTPSLARALCDAAEIDGETPVLDVGCGPGGLTSELAARVDAPNVAAIDPAPQFAAACRERNPGADVREGVAEELPWEDDSFAAALSCLVIRFMRDPDAGVREMARVTRPGGTVALCMWDIATGGMTMLRIFWSAMRQVVPGTEGDGQMAGTSEGDIAERLRRAGLTAVEDGAIEASAHYEDFDDFWTPFTLAVGPAGAALAKLDEDQQAAVREACRAQVPEGAFTLEARAWFGRGRVSA